MPRAAMMRRQDFAEVGLLGDGAGGAHLVGVEPIDPGAAGDRVLDVEEELAGVGHWPARARRFGCQVKAPVRVCRVNLPVTMLAGTIAQMTMDAEARPPRGPPSLR